MFKSVLCVTFNKLLKEITKKNYFSLQAIAQLVDSCGQQVKVFLPIIIPALLKATGDIESNKLSYLSTRLGGTETQEIVDDARASMAKSYFTTETVSKVCIVQVIFDQILILRHFRVYNMSMHRSWNNWYLK